MPDEQPVAAGVWLYVLGGLVIAAGCAAFVYTLWTGLSHITDGLTQIVVPGKKDLALQPNTWYTIFLESESIVDGRIYSTRSDVNGLRCRVTALPAGNEIATHHPAVSTAYNVNGRSGRSVLAFFTQESSAYQLSCAYDQEAQSQQAVLAVGSGMGRTISTLVLTCLAEMFGGAVLGSAMIVFAVLRRKRPPQPIPQGVLPSSR
jgi:hypothetical protein